MVVNDVNSPYLFGHSRYHVDDVIDHFVGGDDNCNATGGRYRKIIQFLDRF